MNWDQKVISDESSALIRRTRAIRLWKLESLR